MKKVRISVSNKALLFAYKNDNTNIEKLLNTNIISHDELLFSEEYIQNNNKIVSSFINEIVSESKIDTIIAETLQLAMIALSILKKTNDISNIRISETKTLSYELCEKIIENKKIKFISCYSISPFMIELLDKHNIKSESRFEILFTSNFMQNNGLSSYSKIYYKMNLRIDFPLTDADIEDFKSFCKLNKYLRSIHFPKYEEKEIEKIITILHEERIKNIKLLIHDNINDGKVANHLKLYNKKIKKKYKLSIKVIYSKEYLNDNLGSELILSTIKMCGLIIFIIVGVVMSCIGFANYQSTTKVEQLKNTINMAIEEYENNDEGTDTILSNKYNALLQLNEETVGWINVKNTKIDYPVVQAPNNDYYLNRDFNKKSSYDGWIFMDFRNKTDGTLNKNTIIYGHNHFYTGAMFGTLSEVTKKKWIEDLDNHIITFDTLFHDARWQIFSVYKIKKTNDYLTIDFESDESFLEFANMLKNRSYHDFMIDIKAGDYILSLSTCIDDDSRLVVHAKLLN